MKENITTLTIFKYNSFSSKLWAFMEMGIGRLFLFKIPGLTFSKQLGTGSGIGFSLKPDFSRYGFLGVWDCEKDADAFLQSSKFIQRARKKSFEYWTVKLKLIQARGKWDGRLPFSGNTEYSGGPVGVLTRATINLKALPRFWKHVPLSSYAIENTDGLISSIGIGELPWIKQATFSVWENMESMKAFAYKNVHKEIIAKTNNEKWYSEDLFARFVIVDSYGSINGKSPVKF